MLPGLFVSMGFLMGLCIEAVSVCMCVLSFIRLYWCENVWNIEGVKFHLLCVCLYD